jgi:hypothetical protein
MFDSYTFVVDFSYKEKLIKTIDILKKYPKQNSQENDIDLK